MRRVARGAGAATLSAAVAALVACGSPAASGDAENSGPATPSAHAASACPRAALDAATGAVRWRSRVPGPVNELSTTAGLIAVGTVSPGRLSLLSAAGRARWSVSETVPQDLTPVGTGTDLVYVSQQTASPGVTRLTDRRLSTGTVRWSTRLTDQSDEQVVWPGGANLVLTEEAGPGSMTTAALAVDRTSGQVRATAPLTSVAYGPLTVSGGDTLIETGAVCAFTGPAAGASPTTPLPPRGQLVAH